MRLCLAIMFLSIFAAGSSQDSENAAVQQYQAVYDVAKDQFGIDPLLMNGIYYENPYYNAKGHPFLGDGEFYLGSVNFRNKQYDGANLKYDIYNQQLIIDQSREDSRSSIIFQNVRYEGLSIKVDENSKQILINQDGGQPKIMNLLANEFVSEFTMDGMLFKKLDLQGEEVSYYQVLAEEKKIACYYYLYKNRFKSQDEGDRTIFVFSDMNVKRYLEIGGEISRFRKNASFLKPFPGESKGKIRNYLKSNNIKVNQADDQTMNELIAYCQTTLENN